MSSVSSLTRLVAIPSGINAGVANARQTTMLSLLGNPRRSYSNECQELENQALAARIVLASVGPFRVRGLRPAVDALRAIMSDIAVDVPAVHAALGSAGMLCARLVRGSAAGISNHSWGTAIDLTIEGVLDRRGDDRVQIGLAMIAPIFNRHGWFWGAAFGTEDAMHFEAGDGLIRRWHRDGLFGVAMHPAPSDVLTLGDRGPDVRGLQAQLLAAGIEVDVDGVFGPATRAAIMAFQGAHGLDVDGVAGPRTRAALDAS